MLDEIEKAHPDVHNILLQVMDHGNLTDSNGRQTDFHNVILIMTTNAGADQLSKQHIGFSGTKEEKVRENKAIKSAFSPEFRNRLDGVVSFNHLPEEVVLRIVEKSLEQLINTLKSKKIHLKVSLKAQQHLATIGYDREYGARPLARVINEKIKEVLSRELLFGELRGGGCCEIDLASSGHDLEFTYTHVTRLKKGTRKKVQSTA